MTKLTGYARALSKSKMVTGKSKPLVAGIHLHTQLPAIADDATSPKKLKSSKYSPSCLL